MVILLGFALYEVNVLAWIGILLAAVTLTTGVLLYREWRHWGEGS